MSKTTPGILATAGVFLLAGVWGTYASIWPDLFRPHPHILFLFLIVGVLLILGSAIGAIIRGCSKRPMLEQPQNAEPIAAPNGLNLELIPHGANSPLLCLEVKNLGEDAKITATIKIVSKSYGVSFNTRPYVGQWELLSYKRRFGDHRPEPRASVVVIPKGHRRILEIAKQASENGHRDISAAYLVGFDEFLQWDFEQKSGSSLPKFRLDIEFLAEGTDSIHRTFDVGPVHAYGPLGMTEVSA
jgi:hypothetical protein